MDLFTGKEAITTACGCRYASADVKRKLEGCYVHPFASTDAPPTLTPTEPRGDMTEFGCGCVATSHAGTWVKVNQCSRHMTALVEHSSGPKRRRRA
jgi:hypothetical protein